MTKDWYVRRTSDDQGSGEKKQKQQRIRCTKEKARIP